MVNISWPMITRRERSTQRWHSFPTLYFLVNRSVSNFLRKKSSEPKFRCPRTRSSPLPGPSGVCSQSLNASSSKTLDYRPSDGRVLNTKSTSSKKKKCKTRRRTPLDGDRSRKAQPEGFSQAEEQKEERPEGRPDHGEEATTGCYSGPKQQCFPSESTSFDSYTLTAKYKMIEELGAGGFAQVFSGVRIEDNFPVALKWIPKSQVRFTEVVVNGTMTKLPLEVHLLTQVGAGPGSASSTVTPLLLDWYDLGSEIILVLERPEPCVDLLHYIQFQHPNGIISSEAKVIFCQLVEAAIEMDKRGVFHRDIKLQNVLIETGADEPKVRFIDFGCGTTFTPGQHFVEPQGTEIFSSPEWFRFEPYAAGPTTVWQLGLVLFAMLFNRIPLISEDTIDLHTRNTSSECRNLLRGCLETDPENRLTLENLRDHPWLNME